MVRSQAEAPIAAGWPLGRPAVKNQQFLAESAGVRYRFSEAVTVYSRFVEARPAATRLRGNGREHGSQNEPQAIGIAQNGLANGDP